MLDEQGNRARAHLPLLNRLRHCRLFFGKPWIWSLESLSQLPYLLPTAGQKKIKLCEKNEEWYRVGGPTKASK